MFSPDVQHQGKAQRHIIRLDYPPAPYALFSRTSLNNKNLKQFLNAGLFEVKKWHYAQANK
jgi:hypothetical protein